MNVLLLSLVVLTSPAATPDEFLLKVGDAAPAFAMRDVAKNMWSLGDHVGTGAKEPDKALIMAFFATWCVPCKKEIPIVKEIYGRWRAKNVGVVYVGLAQGPKDLEPFAAEQQLPWPIVPDSFGLLGRRYGATQLPHIFIFDGEGKIAFQHRGIAPDIKEMLEHELTRITGETVDATAVADAPVAIPAATKVTEAAIAQPTKAQ